MSWIHFNPFNPVYMWVEPWTQPLDMTLLLLFIKTKPFKKWNIFVHLHSVIQNQISSYKHSHLSSHPESYEHSYRSLVFVCINRFYFVLLWIQIKKYVWNYLGFDLIGWPRRRVFITSFDSLEIFSLFLS